MKKGRFEYRSREKRGRTMDDPHTSRNNNSCKVIRDNGLCYRCVEHEEGFGREWEEYVLLRERKRHNRESPRRESEAN